jgi:tetratricopeptide (TPR) repeat protein
MAKAYEYQGNLNAAVDALTRAIAINNRASSYFYVLGTIYRKLGKPEESRKAMESFSKLDRESNELDQKRRDLLREDKAQVSTHEGAARE